MKTPLTNWSIFCSFLINRTKKPLKHPSFVLYFIFIILLIGSFGLINEFTDITIIWAGELDKSKVISLVMNMSNISLSLVSASVIEMILIKDEDLENYPYRKVDIQIFGISSLILSFFLWIFANKFNSDIAGLILSVIGLLFSYTFWWIANAGNKVLLPIDKPIDTLGGVQKTNEQDLSGDTSEFKTE